MMMRIMMMMVMVRDYDHDHDDGDGDGDGDGDDDDDDDDDYNDDEHDEDDEDEDEDEDDDDADDDDDDVDDGFQDLCIFGVFMKKTKHTSQFIYHFFDFLGIMLDNGIVTVQRTVDHAGSHSTGSLVSVNSPAKYCD